MHRQLRPKILIIESQLIIAADISLQCTKLGYNVLGIHICTDDALPTILGNSPDIIIMNIGRSKAVKHKATHFIVKANQIPIVYLSGNTNKEIYTMFGDANPYALISKPFDLQDLKRGIESALQRVAVERIFEARK